VNGLFSVIDCRAVDSKPKLADFISDCSFVSKLFGNSIDGYFLKLDGGNIFPIKFKLQLI
jgi:hypothetical protein